MSESEKPDATPYFVDGPSGACIVYGKAAVEAIIIAMCHVNGDDEDDYTSTEVANVKFDFPPQSIAQVEPPRRVDLH